MMSIFFKQKGSSFLRNFNALMAHPSFGDVLPYRIFDKASFLFTNESSVGYLWIMEPLVGCDPEGHKTLCAFFQHVLPQGASFQCTLIASPHIHPILTRWEHARQEFKDFAKERAEFFTHNKSHPLRSFIVSLSLSAPSELYKNLAFKKLFDDTASHILSFFTSLGGVIHKGSPNDLLSVVNLLSVFSFQKPTYYSWDQRHPLHKQCIPHDYKLSVEDSTLSGTLKQERLTAHLYTAHGFPTQWSQSSMSNLIGALDNNFLQMHTPFYLSYGIHIPNERTLQSRILTKCAQVEKQAASPLARWIPSLTREAQEWSFVRQQCEQGQRVVRTRFQVCVWGEQKEIVANTATLLTLFRHHHFDIQKDTFTMLPSLISCLPMTWGEGIAEDNKRFNNSKTTLSHEPAALLPLQADWKGTPSPGLLLTSRRGQLITWCPFDNNTGNYNVCVIGRSGSGKSVFMQEMALSLLSRKGRVVVIDVGRSFEKIGSLLGGRYIEFSSTSTTSINPFVGIKKGMEDLLPLVKPLLATMASPSNSLSDIEMALLDKALLSTWQKRFEDTTITNIAHTLASWKSTTASHLSDKLFPYTKEGSYGKYFHGPSVPLLDDPFVIIEMEELKERKDLQSVLVQLLITSITSSLYGGDRTTPTHIILDEAWDLLRGGTSALFIETAARRLRKYRGSLVVGTQSPLDFFQTPGAQAAFDNSDWVCFLSQKPGSIQALKQSGKLSLTPHLEDMITSLKTQQGAYAEILIYGPHGYTTTRLLLDGFSQMLFTTKPEEFSFIKEQQRQGKSLTQALNLAKETFL